MTTQKQINKEKVSGTETKISPETQVEKLGKLIRPLTRAAFNFIMTDPDDDTYETQADADRADRENALHSHQLRTNLF